MIEYENKQACKQEQVPYKITCNKCGKSYILTGDEFKDLVHINQFHSFNLGFGYGSNHDTEAWEWHLCEDCLDKEVNKYKIKPIVNSRM